MDRYLWEYSIENDDVDEKVSGSNGGSLLLCPPPPEASADNVVNTTPAKNKQKLNKVEVCALDGDDVCQLFPNLCQAIGLDDGFDLRDPSICKSIAALLTEINSLFSTEYELVVQG